MKNIKIFGQLLYLFINYITYKLLNFNNKNVHKSRVKLKTPIIARDLHFFSFRTIIILNLIIFRMIDIQ